MPNPVPRHVITVALLAAATTVTVLIALAPSSTPGWLYAYGAAAIVATAVFGYAVRRIPSRSRSVWVTLLVAQALSVAGDIVSDQDVVADLHGGIVEAVLYLTSNVVRLVGLVLLIRARAPKTTPLVWLDAVLIATTSLAFLGVFVLVPLAEQGSMSTASPGDWYSVAYSVLDVVTVALLIRVLITGTWNRPLALVTAGQALFLAADLSYNVALLAGRTDEELPGSMQALWLASYVVTAYAATRSDAVTLVERGEETTVRFRVWEYLVIALFAAAVPVTAMIVTGQESDAVLVTLGVVNVIIVALVLARAGVLLRLVNQRDERSGEEPENDPVTGLPGRRAWTHAVMDALNTVAATHGDYVAAIVDVTDPIDPGTVKTATSAWEAVLPDDSFVARLDAARFGVLLPGVDVPAARTVFASMLNVTPASVSLAVGMTECRAGDVVHDVMTNAGIAVAHAHASPGNRIHSYSP